MDSTASVFDPPEGASAGGNDMDSKTKGFTDPWQEPFYFARSWHLDVVAAADDRAGAKAVVEVYGLSDFSSNKTAAPSPQKRSVRSPARSPGNRPGRRRLQLPCASSRHSFHSERRLP